MVLTTISADRPYIIVEYCSLGNLLDLLRQSQGAAVYSNLAADSKTLTAHDLLSFAWQVAHGMSYLSSLKVSENAPKISQFLQVN